MQSYNIQLLPPVSNDNQQLQSTYEHLTKDIATLNQQRDATEETIGPKFAEYAAALKAAGAIGGRIKDGNGKPKGIDYTFASAAIARTMASGAKAVSEAYSIEQAFLPKYIALIDRVNGYLREADDARTREIAIVNETLQLTRSHVLKIYHRDYPPEQFAVSEHALEHYVRNHPTIAGHRNNTVSD